MQRVFLLSQLCRKLPLALLHRRKQARRCHIACYVCFVALLLLSNLFSNARAMFKWRRYEKVAYLWLVSPKHPPTVDTVQTCQTCLTFFSFFLSFFKTGIVGVKPCSLPSLLGFSYSKASQNLYCCALQLVFAPSIRGPQKHLKILTTFINEEACFPIHRLCNFRLVIYGHWQCSVAAQPFSLPRHCSPASVITCSQGVKEIVGALLMLWLPTVLQYLVGGGLCAEATPAL